MSFDKNSSILKCIVVFITSALLMCLEFAEIRIMGFTHWFHFVYFAVTLALLGFAVGGTLISVNKRFQNADAIYFSAICLAGFGISTFLAMYRGATVAPDTVTLVDQIRHGLYIPAIKIYLPLMFLLSIPFIFASLIICRVLFDLGSRANLGYGVNLLGTACGSSLFLLLIGPLGAYRLVYLLIAIAALTGLILSVRRIFLKGLLSAIAILSIAAVFFPFIYFFPKMDMVKNLSGGYPGSIIETKWTPMFRVDIAHSPLTAHITIDGDAQTLAYYLNEDVLNSEEPFVPDRDQVSHHTVFRLVPPSSRISALVIGAGGGIDVLAAYQAGFKDIDTIDINSAGINWLTGKYAHMIHGLYNDPRVKTYVADGRHFVVSGKKRYNAIMLYNVDTVAGVVTGAYNLVENYLYTSNAFQDYFNALTDDGILQVTRPGWGGQTEMLRAFLTCVTTLLNNGLDPASHLLVLRNSYQIDYIISRRALDISDIAGVIDLYHNYGREDFKILYCGLTPLEYQANPLYGVLGAIRNGRLSEVLKESTDDISPTSDDRPFFFENRKWDKIIFNPFAFISNNQFNNWSGVILSISLLLSLIVVSVLVIYTILAAKDRPGIDIGCAGSLYFILIGLGYMLVQMTLIQRLGLILGHPVISMALIIPTLLFSMGLSSIATSKPLFQKKSFMAFSVMLPFAVIFLYENLLMRYLVRIISADLYIRVICVVISLIPLGLSLGVCFPLGLKVFQRLSGRSFIPIAWTANGGASTLGSILAVFISLAFGFHIAMSTANALYALAFLVLIIFLRRE